MNASAAAERAWDLWEQGDLVELSKWLERCRRGGLGDPTGGVLGTLLALENKQFAEAGRALSTARRSLPADDAGLRLANAEFDLSHWRIERARAGFEGLCAEGADGALWLRLSLCADLCGDFEAGDQAAESARELDPESFGELPELDPEEFGALVDDAVQQLAPKFRAALRRWPLLIDPVPQRLLAAARPLETPPDALGLFVGASDLERESAAQDTSPPAIYLFHRNLQRFSTDLTDLREQVATTLFHELGHALGFDEEGVEAMGLE
jgi:predicted Zn-dependent protease with MMP-like domain